MTEVSERNLEWKFICGTTGGIITTLDIGVIGKGWMGRYEKEKVLSIKCVVQMTKRKILHSGTFVFTDKTSG